MTFVQAGKRYAAAALGTALFAAVYECFSHRVYSSFMIELNRSSAICQLAPTVALIYMIIHSILAGFLIALIMYGDIKKGVKFSIPITASAFFLFYLINVFGLSFFGF